MNPSVIGPRRSPSTRVTRPLASSTSTSSPHRSGQSSGHAERWTDMRRMIARTSPAARYRSQPQPERQRGPRDLTGAVAEPEQPEVDLTLEPHVAELRDHDRGVHLERERAGPRDALVDRL